MNLIEEHIATKQNEFTKHRFFVCLEHNTSFKKTIVATSKLAFWVMAFQDILHLNETRVVAPELRKIAKSHYLEDAGHEQWFLKDIATFGIKEQTVRELFDRHDPLIRYSAYALVSEVYREIDDRLRIVLLLALESAGHVFFKYMGEFVDQAGYTERLQYFSKSHLKIEQEHTMFKDNYMEAERAAVALTNLPTMIEAEAIAMIDRIYNAFTEMFNALTGYIYTEQVVLEASVHDSTHSKPLNAALNEW